MSLFKFQRELNERVQIKRQYGSHSAHHVNSVAPVRNSIIKFVGDGTVTEKEMKEFLSKLEEDRGNTINQNDWFDRNSRYFKSTTNENGKTWSLSKFGQRVLERIIKEKEKNVMNEQVGLFKFRVNEAIDIKYWSEYNDDTSGQSPKSYSVKSKDFEETLEDAIAYWEDESGENLSSSETKKIHDLSDEFFKKEKWISINVIHAMISQEL